VLGRLYINKREERARALQVGPFALRRLLRDADRIERDFREGFLPHFLRDVAVRAIADYELLSTGELIAEISRIRDHFVFETHVAVDVINIAAGLYLDHTRRALKAAGIEPSSVLGRIPETFENRAIADLASGKCENRTRFILENFGHRAPFDYEVAEPRYSEDHNNLVCIVAARAQARRDVPKQLPALKKSLRRIVDIAQRYQTLKEDAKHHSLRELAVLRRAIIVLARRFDLGDGIFYLTVDELLKLDHASAASLRGLASQRRRHSFSLRKAAALPSILSVRDLEAATAGNLSKKEALPDVFRGTRVSGSKLVEGRACVLSEEDVDLQKLANKFRDGDVIIAPMITATWLPYFSRVSGFVTEVGGWLSHPAILAREYDVAMVVGVAGIARIADGCTVRIHLDGRIELVNVEENVIAA
jgi:rifampicin phosphotransferase